MRRFSAHMLPSTPFGSRIGVPEAPYQKRGAWITTRENESRNRITKWIRRIARIWSFPIIVYALIMAIGYTWSWATTGVADPYVVEDSPPAEALAPILMFLGVMGLGIAWRWERLGGAISIIFQLATLVVLIIQRPITDDLYRSIIPHLMSMVVAVPGVLFLVCYYRSRRMTTT